MAKPEREFFSVESLKWVKLNDSADIKEKVLSIDKETGSHTRLVSFAPGTVAKERLAHDFWEEAYILEGELIDLTINQTFQKGYYACRPPGMYHGPYSSPIGCMLLEIRTLTK